MNIVLTASNTTPVVDGTVTITATVTQDNQPVPNGTAVEFRSTGGSLDGGGTSTIKTTTNGVATVTLTSGTTGTVRVTATVNNVSRETAVTFQPRPTTPQPPNTAPTISSVSPSIGRPSGGEQIRITGTNFRPPVRVLFRYAGLATPVEAFVVASTETTIDVITPAVNLGAGQQLVTDIIVITQAGTANENRVEAAGAFTFRNQQLTPVISTVTPNSGPVTGGTRVSIFGEGFQEPVQVLFDTAEARVLTVRFNEILVETPAGRDTSPNGTGPVTGPVSVTVRNINSNTSVTFGNAFHYKNAVQITAVGPTEGIFSGGTRVTIDGNGFVAPVAVTIGGVAAQPISVSGTKIVALTSPVVLTGCEDVTGPVSVTNIVNGDTATGPSFTYRVPQPTITNATISNSSILVTVANAQPGTTRITVENVAAFITGTTVNTDGSVTYTVPIPSTLVFPTEACGTGGTRQLPIRADITYLNVPTGCTDSVTDILTINPPTSDCVLPPPAPTATVSPAGIPGQCVNVGSVPAAGNAAGSGTFTVTNSAPSGAQSLTITGATVSGTNATFGISPTGAGPLAPGASATFTVSADPTAAGPVSGTVTITTNDPNRPTITLCVTGSGT